MTDRPAPDGTLANLTAARSPEGKRGSLSPRGPSSSNILDALVMALGTLVAKQDYAAQPNDEVESDLFPPSCTCVVPFYMKKGFVRVPIGPNGADSPLPRPTTTRSERTPEPTPNVSCAWLI